MREAIWLNYLVLSGLICGLAVLRFEDVQSGRLLGDANDAFASGPPAPEAPRGAPRGAAKILPPAVKNGLIILKNVAERASQKKCVRAPPDSKAAPVFNTGWSPLLFDKQNDRMQFVCRSVVSSERNDEIVEGTAGMVGTNDYCRIRPIVFLCRLEVTVCTRLKVTRMVIDATTSADTVPETTEHSRHFASPCEYDRWLHLCRCTGWRVESDGLT